LSAVAEVETPISMAMRTSSHKPPTSSANTSARSGMLRRPIASARSELCWAMALSSAHPPPNPAPGKRSVIRCCSADMVSITFCGSSDRYVPVDATYVLPFAT